jgi:hypothetical protein
MLFANTHGANACESWTMTAVVSMACLKVSHGGQA